MVAVPVLRREDQPPNPLWKFSVLAQILCLVISGLLLFSRCYVRLGFSRLQKEWVLEDGKDPPSLYSCIADNILGMVVGSFVSRSLRDDAAAGTKRLQIGLLVFSVVGSVMANFHAGSHIQFLNDAQIQRIQWVSVS